MISRLPFRLHGHVGDAVSALVDGQLAPEEEERAWAHVLGCPGCRTLVEREAWTKQRLAGLNQPSLTEPVPTRLTDFLGRMPAGPDNLNSLDGTDTAEAWAHVQRLERRASRRRATVALVGAGSLGVAAAALLSLGSPLAGEPGPVERGPASIRPDLGADLLPGPGAGDARIGPVVQSAFEGASATGTPVGGPVTGRVAR